MNPEAIYMLYCNLVRRYGEAIGQTINIKYLVTYLYYLLLYRMFSCVNGTEFGFFANFDAASYRLK